MAAPKGNDFAIGNDGGRPPMFKDAGELESAIDSYFESLAYNNPETGERLFKPSTITGLALALGFCSRQSIHDYENSEEFSYTMQRGRLMVEHSYEQYLYSKSSNGAQFALKNMGWADRTEITHNDKRDKAEQSKAIMDALKNKSRKK